MRTLAFVAVFALTSIVQTVIAQESLTARNTAFIRQCVGLLTRSSVDQYMECWAAEPSNNGRVVSRERLRETADDIVNTFPDFKFVISAVVAEGDTVVVRATQTGTHLGVAKTGFNGGTHRHPSDGQAHGDPCHALVHDQEREDRRTAGRPRRSHDDAATRTTS